MRRSVLMLTILLSVLQVSSPVLFAAQDVQKGNRVQDGDYKAALVMNADTGEILYEKRGHHQHPPASMVKMMLMLLVMEKLETHSISLSDPVVTSARASKYGGSQVYLKHGEVFSLEELMKAMAIHSANDASVAVAEYLTGSVEGCVELMNRRAGELGMKNTQFFSVDGLPPGRSQKADLSTAFDLGLLARELTKYPVILEWTSTKSAPFRNGQFTLTNTNKLIGQFRGADGLKTGYYRKAGYNLTATAYRDGLRLISVVMGASSSKARVSESARLLGIGFNMYKKINVVMKGESLSTGIPVSGAKVKTVAVMAAQDLFVHVRRGEESALHTVLSVPSAVEAPVKKGMSCGLILVKNGDEVLARVDAVAADEVPEAHLFYKMVSGFFD